MKPILDYNIVNGQTPEGESYIRPAIVNRDVPNDLEQILKNAIDRGLIAGLKETACASIAQGIAEQMYKELTDGHSVQFGGFFSIHLYLDGQTDGTGTLREGVNKITPRFQKGSEFELAVSDFTMRYTDDGTRPTIKLVKSEGDHSESGHLTAGEPVLIFGTNLKPAEGQTLQVVFQREVDGEIEETVVDTFITNADDLIKFAYPAIPSAGEYKVVATFEDTETGRVYPSNSRNVECEQSATPAPVITRVKQQNPDLPEDEIDFGGTIVATGENLQMGDGDTIKIELYEGGEPVDVLDKLGAIVSTPTAISFTCSNTSHHPDGEWMGKDVLLTVTIGGVSGTRWLKFRDE